MKVSVMKSPDVIKFYQQLENLGTKIWIDGGWAVDSLLGHQSRPHGDLDIVIQEKDLVTLHSLLQPQGYVDVPRDDTRAWNFVLGDKVGHLIDVHVIVLDHKGNGIYGPPENNQMYPVEALTGKGKIDGYSVSCISPGWLVKFHRGYTLHPSDYQDVLALCEKFGIEVPGEYETKKL